MNDKLSIFTELKRRNVYKVAVAYAVVSWLLIQIATQVFPFFEIPSWAVRFVVLLLILGFPVALILAWAFEITPEGIKRAEDVDPNEPIRTHAGRKLAGITVALALVAAGLLAFQLLRPKFGASVSGPAPPATTAAPAPVPEQSIAVLPFDNLSRDPDNAFFASGIQDEILTRLAKIGALKVISRASTQQYQSKPGDLSEVGRRLGVAHILEGSVQKSGNAVHINVQLIKAATDAHVWAEVYDRKLDDIFGVEGEVATAIADALKAKVTGEEKQTITAKPTNNSEAYDAYLRGVALSRKSDDLSARSSRDYFEQAVRLDPNFATAWALLGRAEAQNFFTGEATEVRRSAARTAVETALRLQPDLPEAQLGQGYYDYYVVRDYAAAASRFEKLLKKWPNNADALEALGLIVRRQNRWEESRRYLDRSAALDPLSADVRLQAADVKIITRDFSGGLLALDEALNVWPDDLTLLSDKALAYQAVGDLDRAEAVLKTLHPSLGVFTSILAVVNQARYRRNYAPAIEQLEQLRKNEQGSGANLFVSSFLLGNLADLKRLSGDATGAQSDFTQARNALLDLLKSQPDNSDLYNALAVACCGLGANQEATKYIERAVNLMPITKDALAGAIVETTRAQIWARFGDRERAIPALERLLNIPGVLTPAVLRFEPDFDPLRGDARFEKLCQEPIASASDP